jgi:uncharacterized protein YjdB
VSLVFAGCGGTASTPQLTSSPSNPPPVTSVTVTPATAMLQTGGTQQFTATVSPPGANQAVTWAIEEAAAGGTVTSTGAYTAPT